MSSMPVTDILDQQFVSTRLAQEIQLNEEDINSSPFLCNHRNNLKKIRWQISTIPGFDILLEQDRKNVEQWHFGLVYACEDEIEMRQILYYNNTNKIDKLLNCVEICNAGNMALNDTFTDLTFSYVFVLANDMKSAVCQPFLNGQLEVKDIGDCPNHPIIRAFYNDSLVGSRFAKCFEDNKVYFGTIDGYNKKKKLWHVKYDDGDEDENDFKETKEGLDLYNTEAENDPTRYVYNDTLEEELDDDNVTSQHDYVQDQDGCSWSEVEGNIPPDSAVGEAEEAIPNHLVTSIDLLLELEDRKAQDEYKGRYIMSEEFSEPITVEEAGQAENDLQLSEHLSSILRQSKISRDIDSIAVLGNNIASMIGVLEENAILKFSQLISSSPSNASRHAIRIKGRTRSGKRYTKSIPIHCFQNITLGIVTAGNVRFHINLYCLNIEEVQKERSNWRPFTTCRRLVVAAAMNLARILQCGMLTMIQREVSLMSDDNSDKVFIQMLLEERCDKSFLMSSRQTQHWVSSGEWFFINREGTTRSEVSSCKAEAIHFLGDLMLALQLISHGLLSLNAVWSWCVAPFDIKKNTDGSSITPMDMRIQGTILFENRYFVLTAAGVKHDFLKYPPFMTKDNCLSDVPELPDEAIELDFNHWLKMAGKHNIKNALKCFKGEQNEESRNVIVTVDDGLNIIPLQENSIMYLPVANNKLAGDFLRQCEQDEFDNMYEQLEINTDQTVDEDENENENEDEDEDEDGECNYEEDENNSDYEDNEVKLHTSLIWIDTLLKVPSIRQSSVNRYPVFNMPLSECEHTGHIPLRKLEDNNTCQLATPMAINGLNMNGTLLGAQKYVTSAKSMKYGNCVQSLSSLQYMDRATFGLLHGPLNHGLSHVKHLGKCLSSLKQINYSNEALQEMVSRKSCLRLECFRLLTFNNDTESTWTQEYQDIVESFKSYPLDILGMPIWVQNKRNFLQNYCGILRKATSTLTNVFRSIVLTTGDGSAIPYNPRLLSKEAKMAVQLCSELVSYELGTGSGYSARGPISIAMIEKFAEGFHFHFLNDSSDPYVREISEMEKSIIGFDHGLDPSIWNFNDQAGKTIGQIVSEVLDAQVSPQSNEKPRLSAALVRETQIRLRSKLFRYQKNNKEKDLYSWLLFVSEFIMVRINQKHKDNCGSAFDAVNHQAFSYFALRNREEFLEIIDGLADLFWICYEWEWQSDILRGLRLDCDWPRTKSNAMEMDRVLAVLDTSSSTRLTPAKGRGNKKDISVKSIEDLSQTVFQNFHKSQENSAAFKAKAKNWDSTIYLNLFKYIASELMEARKNTNRDLGENSYLLTLDFFLARIAHRLIKTDIAHNHDPPILWKTVKTNRLKDRGAYVEVDRMALLASVNEKIDCLKNLGVSFLKDYEEKLSPKLAKSLGSVLSKVCLSKALTFLPFPLNGMNKTQRLGGKIGFGKILMMVIFTQVGGIGLEEVDSVDPENVWRLICGENRSLNKTISNIQLSQVYKLWTTFEVFNERWKLLIKSMHNISTGKKYLWNEIKKSVHQVSFYDADESSMKATCLKSSIDLRPPYIIDAQFVADLKTLSRAYTKCVSLYNKSTYRSNISNFSNRGDFVLYLLNGFRKTLKRDT